MNRQQRRMAVKRAPTATGSRVQSPTEFDVAAHSFSSGRTLQAEMACRALLASSSKDWHSFHRLGITAGFFGRREIAVALLRHAISLKPDGAEAYCSLSSVLMEMNRFDEATEVCQSALKVRPDFAEIYNALGRILQEQGQLEDAGEAYRKAITIESRHAAARFNLGTVFSQQGNLDAACSEFREAIRANPDFSNGHVQLARALVQLERFDEAETCLKQACVRNPDQALYFAELGMTFAAQGRHVEAIEAYKKALSLKPNDSSALNNLGNVLNDIGRTDEAIAAYEFSIKVEPDNLPALSNLGTIYRMNNRLRDAADIFKKTLAMCPGNPMSLVELYNLRQLVCDWAEIEQDEAAVLDLIRNGAGSSIPPFALLSAPTATSGDIHCSTKAWATRFTVPHSRKFKHSCSAAQTESGMKIRIGYLSSDFYNHATSLLIAELLEKHDRSRFTVVGYSHSRDDGSQVRQRVVSAFDEFVDVRAMGHADTAQRVYNDRIDILIDLKGYTQEARTQVFAYRPAPVQVNFLGYPGTMGADFIDYIIGDPVVTPLDHQLFYTEKLVQLPHCYQPNDTKRHIAKHVPNRSECGLPEGAFVFCCFNNTYKLDPTVFAVWMRLLQSVPDSVLWLLEANDIVKENLRREAAAKGVDPTRLVFAPRLSVADHLARHRHADLFLDTLPVNAHTTASDALWAGLPVLTCLGDAFVGRVAASLVKAVGVPELVTTSLAEYEDLALRLARHPEILAGIKEKLARNRLTEPLFDIDRYAQDLEKAFCRMVEIWKSGQSPEAFAVADLR